MTTEPREATQADVEAFAAKVQAMVRTHHSSNFPRLVEMGEMPTISVMMGKRYARLVRKDRPGDKHGSAHAFVELSTGHIYKCASWAVPAKHARGNIFAENPLAACTPYGVVYLR